MEPHYLHLTAASYIGFKEGDIKRDPLIELWLITNWQSKCTAHQRTHRGTQGKKVNEYKPHMKRQSFSHDSFPQIVSKGRLVQWDGKPGYLLPTISLA